MTFDECVDAMRNAVHVWCCHKTHLHCGVVRSQVKIIKMRNDRDVLVKFDDGLRSWYDIADLETVSS